MIRFILMAFLALVMLLPTAQAEEQFESTSCFAGTFNVFHGSKDLTPVMSWQGDGILRSHSENKFLDNATCHFEGVQRGGGESRKAESYAKCIDPDGDIVIIEWAATGKQAVGKFMEGTGKYKGIVGGYKSEPIAQGKPPMQGTFASCNEIKGTFELPPK